MGTISKAEAGYQYRPETEYRCQECLMVKPLKEGDKPESGKEYPAGCAWFGPSDPVSPMRGSCIYFAHAAPTHPEIPWLGLFTKIELGYTENSQGFSCKRCEYFDIPRGDCEKVNRASEGDTPGRIHPNACCDFWDGDEKRKGMATPELLLMISNVASSNVLGRLSIKRK